MSADAETGLSELVISQLRKSGLLPSGEIPDLRPLPRHPGRSDHGTRRSFCALVRQEPACYVFAGPGLSDLRRRAEAFSAACPAIAAKPLFFASTPSGDVLGLEWIPGRLLDDADLPLATAEAAARRVLTELERTGEDATTAGLAAELDQFFAWVQATLPPDAFAAGWLRDVLFPWIRQGATRGKPRSRWTNGDFTARNLIVDPQGRARLIDYEYARRTHFPQEDFLRWHAYSERPGHPFDAQLDEIQPWLHGYFLLRQLALERAGTDPLSAAQGAAEKTGRLLQLAAGSPWEYRPGFFLRQIRELDAEVIKRGRWGVKLSGLIEGGEKQLSQLAASEAALRERAGRDEINYRNLEEQMTHAQALTLSLLNDLKGRDRRIAALESAGEAQRREHARRDAEQNARSEALAGRIARMQSSLSWKLTAPIRALRRLLLSRPK